MKSFVPTNRPVIGADLVAVQDMFGLIPLDTCWLFGMPATKLGEIVGQPKKVVDDPTLALFVRQISTLQVQDLIPATPNAEEVFKSIQAVDPDITQSQLAVMFGRQSTGGYRWLQMRSTGRNVVSRLFLAFDHYLSSKDSPTEKHSAVEAWYDMVRDEGRRRGIKDVFQTGSWRKVDSEPAGKPIIGEDLVMLRTQLGISVTDLCWLLGISIKIWSRLTKNSAKMTVADGTLSLLVRALMNFPAALPIAPPTTPMDAYKRLCTVNKDFDKRWLAIMFGYEESSGSRWIKDESKGTPILERLLRIFIRKFDEAATWGTDDVKHMLAEWDRVVEIEAAARGVPDVFLEGVWSPSPDAQRVFQAPRQLAA